MTDMGETMPFSREELTEVARDAFGEPVLILTEFGAYEFEVRQDDESPMDFINGMDALGRVAWPVRNRDTGRDERPPEFTGAARKFGPTLFHDTIWWEPYREGHKVYDSPEEVTFVSELLNWGTVGCVARKLVRCKCCDKMNEVGHESLWGIESPLCYHDNSGYECLGEVFADLIHQLEVDS